MKRASTLAVLFVAGVVPVLGCLPADPQTTGTGSGGASFATGGSTGSSSGGASTSGGAPGSGGAPSSGGAPGSGGAQSSGGAPGSGGVASSGGSDSGTGGRGSGGATSGTGGRATGGASGTGGAVTGTGGRGTGGASGTGGAGGALAKFSFFMTSIEAMRRLSANPNGFGGDLRFGEANGLAGADKICTTIAETSMPGSGAKGWRAFLSTVGPPVVNAIDRVGAGPWHDRMGRLLAATKADLMQTRPRGGEPSIVSDLPNENGIPNHNPDGTGNVDNHDVLTGTGPAGMAYSTNLSNTCNDWTSAAATAPTGGGTGGRASGPWCGHSWPAVSGMNWMSALAEGGCGPGVNLMEMGPPMPGVYTVGTGGGYGAIYCFALQP